MRWGLILSFVLIGVLYGDSSVWKVTDGHRTMYLGGTVHVLKQSDFPLPQEFYEAYEASELVIFETDIDALQSVEFATAIASEMFYQDGQTLRSTLSRATYMTLKKYILNEGLDMAPFESMKPWSVMMNLTMIQLKKLGIDTPGVDFHFGNRAKADHKERMGLVSIDEHINILIQLGKGEENEMINHTLQEMRLLPEMMQWLVSHWRQGKVDRMEQEIIRPMAEAFPKAYQGMLVQRNDAWMKRLLPMIQGPKTAFVLVGMLHMVGQEGLLEQFRQRGFTVTQL